MRGSSTAALMAAALLLLLVSPAAPDDTYEQESRRMFAEWKAKHKKTYEYAGEEECRYALFKDTRCRVARSKAAGVTTSGLNGLSGHASEEISKGLGVRMGEGSYEEETHRLFVGWKAEYGKIYRDVGEEECRYRLFKGNRRIVVKLNATAAGETAYGLNQFGDLTNEEVLGCYDGDMEEGKLSASLRCQDSVVYDYERLGKLSARCQAAVAGYIVCDYEKRIWSQVCMCIASELKQTSLEVAPFLDTKHTLM